MGVVGAGKTTVGRRLADALGWEFIDADDFHPPENVAKMGRGEPLTDDDRRPWLDRLRAEIDRRLASGSSTVLACSALKRRYRDRLGTGRRGVVLVHLAARRSVIAGRLAGRKGHFAGRELLDSQFAILEPPSAAEGYVVDAEAPPERVVERVMAALSAEVGGDVNEGGAP